MRTKSGILFSALTFLSIFVFLFSISADTSPWATKLPVNERFELVLDGHAVLDNETGLIWERAVGKIDQIVLHGRESWQEGVDRCRKKMVGGRMGWVMPTAPQLTSLIEDGRIYDPPGYLRDHNLPIGHPFLYIPIPPTSPVITTPYWTTTKGRDAEGRTIVYMVNFNRRSWSNGTLVNKNHRWDEEGTAYVWCVRGAE